MISYKSHELFEVLIDCYPIEKKKGKKSINLCVQGTKGKNSITVVEAEMSQKKREGQRKEKESFKIKITENNKKKRILVSRELHL